MFRNIINLTHSLAYRQPIFNLLIRPFSITSINFTVKKQGGIKYDQTYKITKYIKKIDENKYTIGQEHPKGVKVPKSIPEFPSYKYETRFFKRQNFGLYGGLQRKRSKSSSKFLTKNLRAHLPNIQKASLWSEILNKKIKTRVSTRVLRTLTKEGGLDQYLLKDKSARIKTMGLYGWKLRYKLLKKLEQDERGYFQFENKLKPIQHITKDGRKFISSKEELLPLLYNEIQNDSYYPIKQSQMERQYSWLSYDEIVNKLDDCNVDLTRFTV
ncbi:unnamed protein product [Candida verbasci]|uniref:54S ribosomal protein L24, mitochondrial n=1 Tax=Candida verbasci TaxID=1227364 RepID=A0A9W4TRY7_9ASCO|nr:unnamed protein product [Candida verbasci]